MIKNNQRRCRICNQVLVAACDRSKKPELVEFLGQTWTKTKPQFMWLYPMAKKQGDLCFYHQQQEESKK